MSDLNTVEEAIEVLQALREGKQVQFFLETSNSWVDSMHVVPSQNLLPNFTDCKYRVKPEPREFYINIYSNNNGLIYNTQKEAEDICGDTGKTIKVIEVIED